MLSYALRLSNQSASTDGNLVFKALVESVTLRTFVFSFMLFILKFNHPKTIVQVSSKISRQNVLIQYDTVKST